MTPPEPDDPWREPSAPAGELDPWRAFVAGEPVSGRDRASRWLAVARDEGRVPLAVVAAIVLTAAPVGLVWAALSPRVSVSFSTQGPSLEQPESSEFFNADTSFLLALLVAGLVTGAVAWLLTRGRGPGIAVALAVGGTLAGAIAREVGGRWVVDARLARLCAAGCDLYDGTPDVRAGLVEIGSGAVYLGGIVWSIAALVVLVVLTAAFDREEDESARPWSAPPSWPPPADPRPS